MREGSFNYNLVLTEGRHCVSQNEVWGRGCYITLFSQRDVTASRRIVIKLSDRYIIKLCVAEQIIINIEKKILLCDEKDLGVI